MEEEVQRENVEENMGRTHVSGIINDSIQEYLHQRGFIKTLETFQSELEFQMSMPDKFGTQNPSTHPSLLNVRNWHKSYRHLTEEVKKSSFRFGTV